MGLPAAIMQQGVALPGNRRGGVTYAAATPASNDVERTTEAMDHTPTLGVPYNSFLLFYYD